MFSAYAHLSNQLNERMAKITYLHESVEVSIDRVWTSICFCKPDIWDLRELKQVCKLSNGLKNTKSVYV